MQIHQLKPKTRLRREKRVGRGDKTAGRGTKGQKARAGHKIRPAIRDIIKKLPKQRGYRFHSFRPRPVAVDLARIAERFSNGDTVDARALIAKGLIRSMKGRLPTVKILGSRPIQKRLMVRGFRCSAAARARITEAGGIIHEKP